MHSILALSLSLAQTHIFHLTERHALDVITHNIQPESTALANAGKVHTSVGHHRRRHPHRRHDRRVAPVHLNPYDERVKFPLNISLLCRYRAHQSPPYGPVWASVRSKQHRFYSTKQTTKNAKKFLYTTKFHCIAVHSHSCLLWLLPINSNRTLTKIRFRVHISQFLYLWNCFNYFFVFFLILELKFVLRRIYDSTIKEFK